MGRSDEKSPGKGDTKAVRRELCAGVLLFQLRPRPAFLVLFRKDGSPDLPKGHVERGETDIEAALRELEEESGISADGVRLTPGFVFENTYRTRHKKSGDPVEKTVRVFHGVVDGPCAVVLDGHADYAWVPWGPLSTLQAQLHDNPTLLGAVRAWSERERQTA